MPLPAPRGGSSTRADPDHDRRRAGAGIRCPRRRHACRAVPRGRTDGLPRTSRTSCSPWSRSPRRRDASPSGRATGPTHDIEHELHQGRHARRHGPDEARGRRREHRRHLHLHQLDHEPPHRLSRARSPPAAFTPLPAPRRIADSRPSASTDDGAGAGLRSPRRGDHAPDPVAGRLGMDSEASNAVLSVVAVNPTGTGWLTRLPVRPRSRPPRA